MLTAWGRAHRTSTTHCPWPATRSACGPRWTDRPSTTPCSTNRCAIEVPILIGSLRHAAARTRTDDSCGVSDIVFGQRIRGCPALRYAVIPDRDGPVPGPGHAQKDTVDTDALDFAAAGFIDDIDSADVPPPVVDVTTPEVDVDFDDNAGVETNLFAGPPRYVPRRPLIDLPPLADEMEGDQELVTVPAPAAPITAEGRRPLLICRRWPTRLDEGVDDLSPIAPASIRGSATTADSVREVALAGLPTAASPAEPRHAAESNEPEAANGFHAAADVGPRCSRVAVDEPVTVEGQLSTISLPRRRLVAGTTWHYWRPPITHCWSHWPHHLGVSGRDETASAPATSVAEQPASSSSELPPTPSLVSFCAS